MRQRAELIQQIRALESVPIDRWKPVDLTSVAGHGVHDEMSIAELRERLELVKLEREKERDQRRDQIVKEKQSKEQLITSTVQNIVKYRNDLTSQAAVKSVRLILTTCERRRYVRFSFEGNNDRWRHRRAARPIRS